MLSFLETNLSLVTLSGSLAPWTAEQQDTHTQDQRKRAPGAVS